MNALYHLAHARSPAQVDDMRRLEAAGICIFCPDGLAADPDQEVVHRTDHWTVTPNEFPYPGARLHLLLVPDVHVTDLVDLPAVVLADFWAALRWVRDAHGLDFYGLGSRNGDCERTGATIRHVHVHILVGDVGEPGHRTVRMAFSAPHPAG